jgi:hypothetical protein
MSSALANSASGADPPHPIPTDEFVVPLQPIVGEPAAKLIVGEAVAEQLARGRAVIPYRTENLVIRPVFGPAALKVSPRIGHVHVTVDDLPWHWADASADPIIITGLPPGPHSVLIQLEDPTHHPLDEHRVSFVIPEHSLPR